MVTRVSMPTPEQLLEVFQQAWHIYLIPPARPNYAEMILDLAINIGNERLGGTEIADAFVSAVEAHDTGTYRNPHFAGQHVFRGIKLIKALSALMMEQTRKGDPAGLQTRLKPITVVEAQAIKQLLEAWKTSPQAREYYEHLELELRRSA